MRGAVRSEVGGISVGHGREDVKYWVSTAAAQELAAATDRIAQSEKKIAELVGGPALDSVELPARWEVDSARLDVRLRGKLSRRVEQGLPNPDHARGVSALIRGSRAYREQARRRIERQAQAGSLSRDPVPADFALTGDQERLIYSHLPGLQGHPAPADTRSVGDKILTTVGGVLRALTYVLLLGVMVSLLSGRNEVAAALAVLCGVGSIAGTCAKRFHELELTSEDFQRLEGASVRRVEPTNGTREHRLAAAATAMLDAVRGYPAWQSEFLTTHRIQFDPEAEAGQILEHASKISEIAATLGPEPVGAGGNAEAARRQRQIVTDSLDVVYGSLKQRVAALYRYTLELHALNDEYLALQVIDRSSDAIPAVDDLLIQTGHDALAAKHLDRLTADAETLRASIEAHISVLTGDLQLLHHQH